MVKAKTPSVLLSHSPCLRGLSTFCFHLLMPRSYVPSGVTAALLAGALLTGCDSAVETASTLAPASEVNGAVIPGRYIVVLKPTASKNAAATLAAVEQTSGADVAHRYDGTAILGFSGAMSDSEAATLALDSRVAYVEPDRVFTLGNGDADIQAKPGGGGGTQPAQQTPWGTTYVGGPRDGTGKTAWVLDTGIDLDHPDLNVDVARSRNFVANESSPEDLNGHGSHVAGTIGAKNNTIGALGVAPNATVVAVRVLNRRGSGSYSGIIAGVNYVAGAAASGDAANMSLGGGASQALDDAVRAAASRGIRFALAAGNESTDASNSSPARANGTNIYTVSAISSNGCLASFSNYGAPVDFAAPGVSVYATYKDGGYSTLNGTSMAAPHVAGILLFGAPSSSGTICGDKDSTPDPKARF